MCVCAFVCACVYVCGVGGSERGFSLVLPSQGVRVTPYLWVPHESTWVRGLAPERFPLQRWMIERLRWSTARGGATPLRTCQLCGPLWVGCFWSLITPNKLIGARFTLSLPSLSHTQTHTNTHCLGCSTKTVCGRYVITQFNCQEVRADIDIRGVCWVHTPATSSTLRCQPRLLL